MKLVPAVHVGIDEGVFVVIPTEGIEKKKGTVMCLDAELIESGLRGEKGAGPADGKSLLVDLVGRHSGSPVEVDCRIDPFEDALLFLVHFLNVEVAAAQPMIGSDGLRALEGFDEVCC